MHQGAIAAGRGTAAWDGTDDFGRPVVSGACFARLTVEGRGGGGAGSVTAAVRLILLR